MSDVNDRQDGVAPSVMRNKAERLAVAGAIAPVLRENAEKLHARRVKTYDQQKVAEGVPIDDAVVRHVSGADVVRSMLERAKIEIETAPGVRPKTVICATCSKPFKTKPGPRPKRCHDCKSPQCQRCGKQLPEATNLNRPRRTHCFACRLQVRREQKEATRICEACKGPRSSSDSPLCRGCYMHRNKRRERKCLTCDASISPRSKRTVKYCRKCSGPARAAKAWRTRKARVKA